MARIRTIKPEFWVSEQIAECSPSARLTFVGLWNFCDDHGVHPAKPKTLKAELYPMDDITAAQVGEWLAELIRVGLVVEFEANDDGERYWHVTGWERHQKIDRPSYKHPSPPASISASAPRAESTSPRRDIVDDASSSSRRAPPPGMERKGVETKESDSSSARASRSPSNRLPSLKTDLHKPAVSVDLLTAAGFDLQTAADFIAHKDRLKAPLTERAWADHCREAEKAGWTAQQAAEKVMAKGWKGFEAKYVTNEPGARRGTASPSAVLHADDDLTEVRR